MRMFFHVSFFPFLLKFQLEIDLLISGIVQHHESIIGFARLFTVEAGNKNTPLL